MIIFWSIFTTIELSIFWRQLGQYWQLTRAQNRTTIRKFSLSNSAKRSVSFTEPNNLNLGPFQINRNTRSVLRFGVHQKDQGKSTDAKAAHRMLLNSTPGVKITIFLLAAFVREDPKSTKKHWGNYTVFLDF